MADPKLAFYFAACEHRYELRCMKCGFWKALTGLNKEPEVSLKKRRKKGRRKKVAS